MILDYPGRPVRPPLFFDHLATQWVTDWDKKLQRRSAQQSLTPRERRQIIRDEAIRCAANTDNPLGLQMSGKMGAGKYYILNATSTEADLRNKWRTGSEAYESARTYGRKPRIDHRTVMVLNFPSTVSLREVHRTFTALAS